MELQLFRSVYRQIEYTEQQLRADLFYGEEINLSSEGEVCDLNLRAKLVIGFFFF